nr:HAD family hydrolase [Paenibacillus hamazuiensis]
MITDLDGTLLTHDKKVRLEEKRAIREAALQGVRFGMASGRMHPEMAVIARDIGIPMHIVSQNGAFVHTSEGKQLRETFFMPETVRQIMRIGAKFDLLSVVCAFDRNIVAAWDERAERKQERMSIKLSFEPDVLERLGGGVDCSKITFFGPIDLLLQLQTDIRNAMGHETDTFISDADCLDVMPRGISKGSGLGILMEHLGLEPEQVVCIGDSFNDVPMFRAVSHSFAMPGSHPDVRRYARYNANSVSHAIEWLLSFNRKRKIAGFPGGD